MFINQIKCVPFCNLEILYVAIGDKRKILNRIKELVTQCPHYRKNFFGIPTYIV